MYGASGSMELGYASAAIIVALINKLVQNNVISRSDPIEVMGDALKTMRPGAASKGVAGARANYVAQPGQTQAAAQG